MIARAVFLVTLVVGVLVVIAVRRRSGSASETSHPTLLGWSTLALGLIAVAMFVLAATGPRGAAVYLTSIASATAAVVMGIGALSSRDRHWPTWVGLAIAVVPALGWVAFAVGSRLSIG